MRTGSTIERALCLLLLSFDSSRSLSANDKTADPWYVLERGDP